MFIDFIIKIDMIYDFVFFTEKDKMFFSGKIKILEYRIHERKTFAFVFFFFLVQYD